MALALTYCALGSQMRWDASTTLVLTEQCIPLVLKHRFLVLYMLSSVLRAWALSELERPEEGLVLMLEILKQWERSGLRVSAHHNLGVLASIYLRLGRVKEGLAAVDEALTLPPRTKEYWYLPELHRTRGGLLRMAGREAEAREAFLEALHFAHAHEMTLYERRARASLSQLSEPHEASFHEQ
jgi:predicted RNA polymerase sigma factor